MNTPENDSTSETKQSDALLIKQMSKRLEEHPFLEALVFYLLEGDGVEIDEKFISGAICFLRFYRAHTKAADYLLLASRSCMQRHISLEDES